MAVPDSPTIFKTAAGNTIDFALYRADFDSARAVSLSELSSDHNPVAIKFLVTTPTKHRPPRQVTHWKKFYGLVGVNVAPLFDRMKPNSPGELDALVTDFTEAISQAHKDALLPPVAANKPYIPNNLKGLIRWRNKLRKQWQDSRLPSDKQAYKLAQRIVKKELRVNANNQWVISRKSRHQ